MHTGLVNSKYISSIRVQTLGTLPGMLNFNKRHNLLVYTEIKVRIRSPVISTAPGVILVLTTLAKVVFVRSSSERMYTNKKKYDPSTTRDR